MSDKNTTHITTKLTEVKSRLLLDVVVRQGAAVLELLAGEDEALLIRGNAIDDVRWRPSGSA